MNKPMLDSKIMKTMQSWGNNFDNTEGDTHNSEADKIDKKIDNKDITLNIPSAMDAPHPKVGNETVDKGFWAKAKPQTGTVGEGLLTRKLKD